MQSAKTSSSGITGKTWLGHLAAFTAYLIFGFNIVISKDLISGHYISPIGIFLLRSLGAGTIFWVLSLFLPKEKVALRDLPKIFLASALGFFLTQLTFLVGIDMITPMECSIVSALTPIFTMFIAAIAIREPITLKKVGGVLLSFSGVIYLIVTSMSSDYSGVGKSWVGLLLIIANALCFAMYLGIFKPLISRYSVVTFMKWVFLFAFLMASPLALPDLLKTDFSVIPPRCLWDLAFIIVFATFVAYFLVPLGQKIIRPTLVSMYSYMQPIVAIAISIWVGMDMLTPTKVIATVMVFTGVYIVNRSRSATPRHDTTEKSS